MKEIIKPTLILAIVAFIASFALSHINRITRPEIERQEREKEKQALSQVLPGYSIIDKKTEELNGEEFTWWKAEKTIEEENITVKGYAFICEKPGYSGPVRSMAGVDEKGIILGLSVLQQSETPGLGARSTEIASKLTFLEFISGETADAAEGAQVPWFQEQFSGIDASEEIKIVKKGTWNKGMKDELIEQNAVSAITGATITTKAVRDSIEAGIEKLNRVIEEDPAGKVENETPREDSQ